MKTFKALVKDTDGKTLTIESDYNSKAEFIDDLRRNGFRVNRVTVKTKAAYDHIVTNTNGQRWDWTDND